MSILHDICDPPVFIKISGDHPSPVYTMAGTLYAGVRDYRPVILLTVPVAIVRGAFDALSEEGIELPSDSGHVLSGVVVISAEELAALGGVEKLVNDRGRSFNYSLGRVVAYDPSSGEAPGISRLWAYRVHSPQLQQLRRSHGLPSLPTGRDLMLPVAVRKRGVLREGSVAKDTLPA